MTNHHWDTVSRKATLVSLKKKYCVQVIGDNELLQYIPTVYSMIQSVYLFIASLIPHCICKCHVHVAVCTGRQIKCFIDKIQY